MHQRPPPTKAVQMARPAIALRGEMSADALARIIRRGTRSSACLTWGSLKITRSYSGSSSGRTAGRSRRTNKLKGHGGATSAHPSEPTIINSTNPASQRRQADIVTSRRIVNAWSFRASDKRGHPSGFARKNQPDSARDAALDFGAFGVRWLDTALVLSFVADALTPTRKERKKKGKKEEKKERRKERKKKRKKEEKKERKRCQATALQRRTRPVRLDD